MFSPDLLTVAMPRLMKGRRADRSVLFAETRETIRLQGTDGGISSPMSGMENGISWLADRTGARQFVHVDGLDEATMDRLIRIVTGTVSHGPCTCGKSSPPAGSTKQNCPPRKPVSSPSYELAAWGTGTQGQDCPLEPTLHKLIPPLGQIHRGALMAESRCTGLSFTCAILRQKIWVITDGGGLSTDERKAIRISAQAEIRTPGGASTGTSRWGSSDDGFIFTERAALELGRRAAESAAFATKARHLPPGFHPLVLAAGCGGILFHEACGHMLEADHVRRGQSPYSGRIGDLVASPLVTILDDPTIPGLAGSFRIDDEGTTARQKILIEEGRLSGFLADLRHASRMKGFEAGNGRRRSYRYPPIPRMSNTLIREGTDDSRQIIEETDKGLLATQISRGRVDPSSGAFRFTVAEGYLIENGRLSHPVAGAVVSGSGPETLPDIDRVGNDPKMDPAATGCDKDGQTIPVSMGHPTIRISSLRFLPP